VSAPLVAGDSFLLCSDGLWAHFSDAELGAAIAAAPAREAAQILIAHARERAAGCGDNISLAVVKLVEGPARNGATTQ
jgi:serine/threonine protein phosphatase PrpC